ncbi:hypothetical protein SERLADRAFT_360405 [Serpula lacrymans var. lacrymans S7.9]|uniref:N-acetyltransferase domain-containing protein n=1 Tax=Serpula lacrymans var. lacrymans (strain S7.9) TaxID=578457 RepID=F8NM48_SERL9|nr:uncharacterized protein SERLADRAFT_360405 [Serpula lacrymans var. lacrymans S7.9]EGO27836.1 hypothetical protein SERLADRAFT_360405 [Serpula lacrymans var. lacrymans S7.9]
MTISIRPATSSDAPALSHICLVTGNAGTTAEHLHNLPEMLGLVYAVPYVNAASTWGFVLVDQDDEGEKVVGYTLGAIDTRAFEKSEEEMWWPALRAEYSPYLPPDSGEPSTDSAHPTPTEADMRIIRHFLSPPAAPAACVSYSTAHLHIDILPAYQRRGLGRQLIDRAIQHMRNAGLHAVWLGMDTKNVQARIFYERLGFSNIEGAPEGVVGLRFVDWKG